MECTAICRICGLKISCKDGNVITLGEHLLTKHPEIDINHYVIENGEDWPVDNKSSQKTKSRLARKLSQASSVLRTATQGRKKTKGTSTRRSLYKTTVESWHPGVSPLKCPKCGNEEQPYIRKQRNKVAYNSLGAFFLLGCWPLCFLPMLMSGGANTIICCRKCGYCFGTYDKKKGQLIPSTKDIRIETPNLCES